MLRDMTARIIDRLRFVRAARLVEVAATA